MQLNLYRLAPFQTQYAARMYAKIIVEYIIVGPFQTLYAARMWAKIIVEYIFASPVSDSVCYQDVGQNCSEIHNIWPHFRHCVLLGCWPKFECNFA